MELFLQAPQSMQGPQANTVGFGLVVGLPTGPNSQGTVVQHTDSLSMMNVSKFRDGSNTSAVICSGRSQQL